LVDGRTLTSELKDANMVLVGTVTNAQLDPNEPDDWAAGTADLLLESVLKKDPILGGDKVLTLHRFIAEKKKYVIFFDVVQGKIDPYRGIPVEAGSDLVQYLKGAMRMQDKDPLARLRFFFDYLENKDPEIANDAYKEFVSADYKILSGLAKGLPPDTIARWLQDPKTPAWRHDLYAAMLGHCGKEKHAGVLLQMIEDSRKRSDNAIHGILTGYTMLKPKEGWARIRRILLDPSEDFRSRYAALRAIRFFWDSRHELVARNDLIAGLSLLLDQGDMADLAIEELRQHKCWELSVRVIGLYGKKSHDVPVVRRALLLYALSCPPSPEAAALVKELRAKNPDIVRDAEELLKIESDFVTGGLDS
jgi:hypothetical protein